MSPSSPVWWTSEFWGVTYRLTGDPKIVISSKYPLTAQVTTPKSYVTRVPFREFIDSYTTEVHLPVTVYLLWMQRSSGTWWGTGTCENLWAWWSLWFPGDLQNAQVFPRNVNRPIFMRVSWMNTTAPIQGSNGHIQPRQRATKQKTQCRQLSSIRNIENRKWCEYTILKVCCLEKWVDFFSRVCMHTMIT